MNFNSIMRLKLIIANAERLLYNNNSERTHAIPISDTLYEMKNEIEQIIQETRKDR